MRIRPLLCSGLSLLMIFSNVTIARSQRTCGHDLIYQNMVKENPAQYEALQDKYRLDLDAISALAADPALAKTAATGTIPVVFHFVLTNNQHFSLGRDSGIMRRVITQLEVLNQDFNRQNADSVHIPAAFKPRYGNPAIRFARAGFRNANTIAAGVEVKIIPTGTTFNAEDMCVAAKSATTGLEAWDNTKYLNIWVVRVTTGGAGSVLGVTTPPYLVGYNVGGHTVTPKETGIVMNYLAFGKRESNTQNFLADADRGKTLTHEMGHFFELLHIWGDDDNADTATRCTTYPGGYDDDLVNDTPPQGKRTYCDRNGTSCPSFPLLDKCSPAFPGIMFMNYMDYVVDSAMHLFTVGQATRMNYYLGVESISLTQNPGLLAVNDAKPELGSFAIGPNPSRGSIQLHIDQPNSLRSIVITNMVGQTIKNIIALPGQKSYNFDLSNAPRGLYLVQCRFDGGTLTEKLVLE